MTAEHGLQGSGIRHQHNRGAAHRRIREWWHRTFPVFTVTDEWTGRSWLASRDGESCPAVTSQLSGSSHDPVGPDHG